MKTVAVCILLAVVVQRTHADYENYFEDDLVTKLAARSVIGNKIKNFLESFKETMKNGDESMGIPVLDPFDLEHQDINVEHYLINATGEVNNLHLEGLSDFEVQFADFKVAKKNFSINLLWPKLKGNTLYSIDAMIADYIPIYGTGEAEFEVTNLTFATNAKLKLDPKTKNMTIVEFSNTAILIDALKLDAIGLYDDEELSKYMSGLISKIAPPGLVDFQVELVTEVDKAMLELGNQLLPSIVDKIWEIIMPKN